jgi:hypothetical protein
MMGQMLLYSLVAASSYSIWRQVNQSVKVGQLPVGSVMLFEDPVEAGYFPTEVTTYIFSIVVDAESVDYAQVLFRRWSAGLIAKFFLPKMTTVVCEHYGWVAMMPNDKSKQHVGRGCLDYTVVVYWSRKSMAVYTKVSRIHLGGTVSIVYPVTALCHWMLLGPVKVGGHSMLQVI